MSMREIVPGLWHWTAVHPHIRSRVSSYYLSTPGVLIDPLAPEEGIEWFADHGPPTAILLSNRHHFRDCAMFVEAFSIPIRASRPGMHEFGPGQGVVPFDFGDMVPGDVVTHEVGAICPDETALEIPGLRALSVADGVVRLDQTGPLGFVPDFLLGEDPEDVKRGLCAAYTGLLGLDFDHLLLAHGEPIVGVGKARLREFVQSASA
jgi:hypothetical protein